MATPCIQSMEEYYFGRIFDSRYCLSSKRRCPYWRILFSEMADFFVSIESQTLTALNSLFEEMSKIIPWSRCSGDPTSVKCKANVDSYKTCSVFKGREYVVSYGYDEDLIVNWRTAEDRQRRHCVSQAYYIFLSHDFDVFYLWGLLFSVFKIDWNCNFVGLLHHPFWLQLI